MPRGRAREPELTASTVQDCLDTLVAYLGLEERAVGHPEASEWEAITNELDRSVGWVFSTRAADQSMALHWAVSSYAGEQSADWFDRVVEELLALLAVLRADLVEGQAGAAWLLNRQLLALSQAIRTGTGDGTPGYRGLQAALASSPWFLADLGRLAAQAGLDVEKLLPARAPWLQDNEKRCRRLLKTTREAPLGSRIDQLTSTLELRRRQLQDYLRFDGKAPHPLDVWCATLNEVYARLHPGITPQRVESTAAHLAASCRHAGLESWAELLDDPAALAGLAREALWPPGVHAAWLNQQTLPALTQGRLASFCGLPFCHALEPFELITSALVARPILHAGHAAVAILLEHSLLAETSVRQQDAPFFFDVLRELETSFRLWLDAYLLVAQNPGDRMSGGGRPVTPDGWCALLGGLRDVFFCRAGSVYAEQLRADFLARLGLATGQSLLLQLELKPRWVN